MYSDLDKSKKFYKNQISIVDIDSIRLVIIR